LHWSADVHWSKTGPPFHHNWCTPVFVRCCWFFLNDIIIIPLTVDFCRTIL